MLCCYQNTVLFVWLVLQGYLWLERAAEKDREARALLKAMRDKGGGGHLACSTVALVVQCYSAPLLCWRSPLEPGEEQEEEGFVPVP